MTFSLIAPDVETLIYGLMPWLDRPNERDDNDRSRSLSRSGAIRRRVRSPSLSPFWQSVPDVYSFFQLNFSLFARALKARPKLREPPSFLEVGVYFISCRGLRIWNDGTWITIRMFDSIDVITSFPLTEHNLYFEILA